MCLLLQLRFFLSLVRSLEVLQAQLLFLVHPLANQRYGCRHQIYIAVLHQEQLVGSSWLYL
jgi:hypothetical protein